MIPVGFVTALPAEAQTLLGRQRRRFPLQEVFRDDDRLIVVGGIGRERAARAARQLIEAGARGLVSWGCAGALHETLAPGALLLPSLVLADGRELSTDAAWRDDWLEALGTQVRTDTRPLLTTDEVMTGSAAKRAAFARHGAVAVDMESAAIAAEAASAALPFMAVRAIADPCDLSLPAFLPAVTDEFGRPQALALGLALLRHPPAVATLLTLRRCFHRSLGTLANAAELVGGRRLRA